MTAVSTVSPESAARAATLPARLDERATSRPGAVALRNEKKGALVTSVDTAGPAEGRLQSGDLIQWIDGRRVRSMADLRSRLYLLAPGAWVTLGVERDGELRTLGLSLGTSP